MSRRNIEVVWLCEHRSGISVRRGRPSNRRISSARGLARHTRVQLVLLTFLLVNVTGCGSDRKPPPKSHRAGAPPVSATRAWGSAVDTYTNWFHYCLWHISPARDVVAFCMREPRSDYRRAEVQALRALSRVSSGRGCRKAAERARSNIRDVTRLQDDLVRAYDRANDAALAGRNYRGRSLNAITRQANDRAKKDFASARRARMTLERC
jgi:hypothetical protein